MAVVLVLQYAVDRQSLAGLMLAALEVRPVRFRHEEKFACTVLSAVALQQPERGILLLAPQPERRLVDEPLRVRRLDAEHCNKLLRVVALLFGGRNA